MIHAKNKTALLELKKDLELVHNGAQILEEKRNILLKEIISVLDEVEEERTKLNEAVRQSYRALIKAFMESGKVQLKKEAALPVFNGKLHVYEKSFIGILTPKITYELQQVRFPLDISGETLFLEVARKSFIDTASLILALAEIEFKAWRLAKELKKTVVRVNALQKYYVPEYDKAIKETATALEEVEREFLLVLKKSKQII
ncbi:MAG: V-type ATP synthase subunit D [Campylobacterota bacterium]|nr:V-type ATP synthase subunit D [Campylobacterota bacterium]